MDASYRAVADAVTALVQGNSSSAASVVSATQEELDEAAVGSGEDGVTEGVKAVRSKKGPIALRRLTDDPVVHVVQLGSDEKFEYQPNQPNQYYMYLKHSRFPDGNTVKPIVPNEKGSYDCPFGDGKTFISTATLRQHVYREHDRPAKVEGEPEITSPRVTHPVKTVGYNVTLETGVFPNGEKVTFVTRNPYDQYECPFDDGKAFTNLPTLKAHLSNVHDRENGSEPAQPRRRNSPNAKQFCLWMRHDNTFPDGTKKMRAELNADNKFVCPFDNKEFVKLSSLRWHITLHHDQRKDIEPVVTTPVLTLKYSTFPDGTRQKDIIVNDKGFYECPLCPPATTLFQTLGHMRSHVTRIHDQNPDRLAALGAEAPASPSVPDPKAVAAKAFRFAQKAALKAAQAAGDFGEEDLDDVDDAMKGGKRISFKKSELVRAQKLRQLADEAAEAALLTEDAEPILDYLDINRQRPWTVHMGDHSQLTTDDAILTKHNLVINKEFQFVACTLCGIQVTANYATHVKQHADNVSADDANHIKSVVTKLGKAHYHHGAADSVVPVQGLRVKAAWQCSFHLCNQIIATIEERIAHAHGPSCRDVVVQEKLDETGFKLVDKDLLGLIGPVLSHNVVALHQSFFPGQTRLANVHKSQDDKLACPFNDGAFVHLEELVQHVSATHDNAAIPQVAHVDITPLEPNTVYLGDGHQLLRDSKMDEMSVAINQLYNFVACLICGTEMTSYNDFVNLHTHGRKHLAHSEYLRDCFAWTSQQQKIDNVGTAPVQGIRVLEAFRCRPCDQFFFLKEQRVNHVRLCTGQANWKRCAAQQRNVQSRVYEVSLVLLPHPQDEEYDDLLANLPESTTPKRGRPANPLGTPKTPRTPSISSLSPRAPAVEQFKVANVVFPNGLKTSPALKTEDKSYICPFDPEHKAASLFSMQKHISTEHDLKLGDDGSVASSPAVSHKRGISDVAGSASSPHVKRGRPPKNKHAGAAAYPETTASADFGGGLNFDHDHDHESDNDYTE